MNILLLGSGPSAPACRSWPRTPFDMIVVLNNAWQLRPDWDALVFPYDFPPDRMPPVITARQQLVDESDFVPAMNTQGGFLYGGATMAFTATYWALAALSPRVIAYLGCDMVYPSAGPTHFYGQGTADPLRDDISLRSLEAKSARATCFAARQGCALVNLSDSESRLTFPRATRHSAANARPIALDAAAIREAEHREAHLNYRTPTGFHDHIDADLHALDAIDHLWLAATKAAVPA